MATKRQAKVTTKALEELIDLTLRSREDSKRIKDLRKEAQKEAKALYQAKEWPIGKDMPVGKGTLRLYHEKVYTWEKNHQIKDALIDIYCSQKEHVEWLKQQIKKTESEMKMTCQNLELAYPDSDSIKQELRMQIR